MTTIISANGKTVYPFIFETSYGSMGTINCYLLDDGEKLTLIDAGIAHKDFHTFFDEQLATYGFTYDDIDQIILTHHHEDHVGQVNKILAHKTIPVYAHHLGIERLHFDKGFLSNKIIFFKQLYRDYGCYEVAEGRLKKLQKTLENSEDSKIQAQIIPLYEGDTICGMQVIEVPGHAVDLLMLYDPATKWLFSSDLVFKHGSANAIVDFDEQLKLLPTVAQQKHSLEKAKLLDVTVMLAGHQQPFTDYIEVIDRFLARIDTKCQRVVQAIRDGHHRALEIARVIYGTRLDKIFPLIMSEIVGYLYFAEQSGFIVKKMQDGQWNFELVEQ